MLPPALASCPTSHTLLCPQEPGFAEVLPNLTAQEMDWLVLGELQMALERVGALGLRISGHIAARQSCDGETGGAWHPGHTPLTGTDTWPGWVWEESGGLGRDERPWGKPASTFLVPPAVLQSVLCGADALIPVQTGAAGSARLTLLGNGSLIYQVRVSS